MRGLLKLLGIKSVMIRDPKGSLVKVRDKHEFLCRTKQHLHTRKKRLCLSAPITIHQAHHFIVIIITGSLHHFTRVCFVQVADWWGPAQKLLRDHGNTINGGAFFPQYLQFYDVTQISQDDVRFDFVCFVYVKATCWFEELCFDNNWSNILLIASNTYQHVDGILIALFTLATLMCTR